MLLSLPWESYPQNSYSGTNPVIGTCLRQLLEAKLVFCELGILLPQVVCGFLPLESNISHCIVSFWRSVSSGFFSFFA